MIVLSLCALLLNGCVGSSRPSAPAPSGASEDAPPPEMTDEQRGLLRGDPTR